MCDQFEAIKQISKSGRCFDKRPPADEDWEPLNGFCVTPFCEVVLSGQQLSKLIRESGHSFPNGIDIRGICIDGTLDISGLRLDNLISFRECYFSGNVIVRDAHIGPFSLAGSVVSGVTDLRGSFFAGFLFLRFGFVCFNGVLLRESRIETTLNCEYASFFSNLNNDLSDYWKSQIRGEAFAFERSNAATLIWRRQIVPPNGIVNFRDSYVNSFRDELDSPRDLTRDWPNKGNLHIEGFEYKSRTRGDPHILANWLVLQDTSEKRNYVSPYNIMVSAFEESGERSIANHIGREREKILLRREKHFFPRFVRAVFYYGSHGGYNVGKAIRSLLAVFLFCTLAICIVFSMGEIVPNKGEVLKDPCFQIPNECPNSGWRVINDMYRVPNTYPPFSAVGFTLDVYVPGIEYGFETPWRAYSSWSNWVIASVRTIGILMFSMVAIAITGIVRRK